MPNSKIDMKEAIAMRLDGCTLEQIAKRFGVSRQSVHQKMAHFIEIGSGRKGPRKPSLYPNIDKWLSENGLSMSKLEALAGFKKTMLGRKAHGRNEFTKREIDALINITGIPYEELFRASEVQDAQ